MEVVEKSSQSYKVPSFFGRAVRSIFRRSSRTEPTNLADPLVYPRPIEPSPAAVVVGQGRAERTVRIAKYQTAKPVVTDEKIITPAPVVERQEAPAKHLRLPSGFKEVRKANQVLKIPQEEIPWLREDENCNLVLITMADSKNSQLYFGSAIRGKTLIGAANNMSEHQKSIADNLLYAHLPAIAESGKITSFAQKVIDTITDKPIFYFANRGGQRVYFMQFNGINSIPVIIRVAVCDKANQAEVLTILTTKAYKDAKRLGKT